MKTLINILLEIVDAFTPRHLNQPPAYDLYAAANHTLFSSNQLQIKLLHSPTFRTIYFDCALQKDDEARSYQK